MDEREADKDLKLGNLLNKFSISLKHYKDWIFYLWIIEIKCGRKPPTSDNVNSVWLPELLKVRNDRDFRECYVNFKEVYDFLKEEFNSDLFTKTIHEKFERRYEGG